MFVRERDWKGPVAEAVGWQGYALFSEEALAKLNINTEGLKAVKIADAPVRTFGLNLKARHKALLETRQVVVSPEEADAGLTFELDVPPPIAWEWLNDPQRRNQWWESFICSMV